MSLLVSTLGSSCWGQSDYRSTAQQPPATDTLPDSNANKQPYVLILPGILGEQFWDRNIYSGLVDYGYQGEVEIYDWTQGPLAMPVNMGGDGHQIDYLAQRILEFKKNFPQRRLFLIGHSGGCKMAVGVLERLSSYKKTPVEKALLLAPCLSSRYDLRAAMSSTKSGIAAFCSPLDVPIPLPLTLAHGVANGNVSMSAAFVGFQLPVGLAEYEQTAYRSNLYQRKYQLNMVRSGHVGGHFGWTNPKFVASYLAPLIR